MDRHARYNRDCVRAALGTLPGGIEALGAAYRLHQDDAIEICDSAYAILQAAGIKTTPRWKPASPGMERRLQRAYERRGLRAARS
jgi:hypothetical protein